MRLFRRKLRPWRHIMEYRYEGERPTGRMLAVCKECGYESELHCSGHVIYAEIGHQSDLRRDIK